MGDWIYADDHNTIGKLFMHAEVMLLPCSSCSCLCTKPCMLTLSSEPTMSKPRCPTSCQNVAHLPADTSCYTTNGTAIIVSSLLLRRLFFAPV